MADLPEVRERFVADVTAYSRPLREAAKDADKFGNQNDKAALAARRMGLAAKEAADKAARAQRDAADAAEKLARGELKADEATQAAARAQREMERASIRAAEAQRATANAADKAAANYKQLARDAALAGAAQRLASLKASGAVKEHNTLLKQLEHQFGDLSKEGEGAFQAIGVNAVKAGTDVSTMAKVGIPAALVGLQLLPAAASAAGGGITLALGGALSAIGIMAAAKAKDVQDAFARMKTNVGGELKAISIPFHDTLLNIAKDAQSAFDGLAPTLSGAFAKMAPAITRFSHSFSASLTKLNPAIDSIGTAFSRVLDSLGGRMPAIMNNFGTAVKAITDAVAANPGAFAGFVEGVSKITRYLGDGIGFLIRYSSQLKTMFETANAFAFGPLGSLALGLKKVSDATGGSSSVMDVAKRSVGGFGAAIVAVAGQATATANAEMQTGMATRSLMTAQQAAALTATQLKGALDALTGKTLTERESMVAYRQAITAMTASLKANGAAHGFATAKGAANEQALDQMAIAAQKASVAMKDDGRSAKDVSIFLEGARQRIIAAAEKMHYSASAAKALADKLLGVRDAANKIPTGHNIKLSDNATDRKRAIDSLQRSINALHGKTITITTIERAIHYTTQRLIDRTSGPGHAHGGIIHRADGGPVGYPDGGAVSGPGTATSDSIPAMLSNGEFVVNAAATRRHRELLEAINAGIPGYAKGGHPKSVLHAPTKAAAAKLSFAKHRPEELAALAAQASLASMRSSALGSMRVAGLVGTGSGQGTTVMHVTNVNVTVQGSIRSDRDIVDMIQQKLLTGRKAVTLPAGR